jgi:hydrogenase-4 component E
MGSLLGIILVTMFLLNFYVLGTSRIRAVIRVVGLQGILLGIAPVLIHGSSPLVSIGVTLPAVILKGVLIPLMLFRALSKAEIKREVEPLVGFAPSLVLGALGTALAIVISSRLPLLGEHAGSLITPAALSTIFTGFIFLTTRRKAISQVLGYLMLENGIFLFGLLLVEAVPFLIEVGMLLDLFVAIFVMGIIINHINREFSSIDTQHLKNLRETE